MQSSATSGEENDNLGGALKTGTETLNSINLSILNPLFIQLSSQPEGYITSFFPLLIPMSAEKTHPCIPEIPGVQEYRGIRALTPACHLHSTGFK